MNISLKSYSIAIRSSFRRVYYPLGDRVKDFEALCILPSPSNLLTVYGLQKLLQPITQRYPKPLASFISLTRAPFSPVMKLSCDWCSICNGLTEHIRQSIVYDMENNSSKIVNAAFKTRWLPLACLVYLVGWMFWVPVLLRISTHTNTPWIPVQTLFKVDSLYQQPLATRVGLATLTHMYNLIQLYEIRWCPFKHMKDVYTAHPKYQDFIECTDYETLFKCGEIIAEHGQIDCYKCAELVKDVVVSSASCEAEVARDYVDFVPFLRLLENL
jgi:hypothetical protein